MRNDRKAYKGEFQVDVFDCSVYMVVSPFLRRSINATKRHYKDETIDFEPAGYFYRPGLGDRIGKYYIFIHKDCVDHNTINHEQQHLLECILSDRSIRNKGEVTSYLNGYLSKKINQFFKKNNLIIK